MALEITFLITIGLLAYIYGGYHILVTLLARFTQDRSPQDLLSPTPKVSVIVAMFNEEDNAVARVENLLDKQYESDALEVIVVLDAPTDATEKRLKRVEDPRLRVIRVDQPSGKAACLNRGIEQATGEILVFCDARQRFKEGAIRALARHFSDEKVGAVSGELVIAEAEGGAGHGVGSYWRIEKALRKAESKLGSSIGCTGAIYAARRSICTPIPDDTILDDVLIPMRALTQGLEVRFESEAIAVDPQSTDPRTEVPRKIRTLAGNYQLLFRYPEWLLPWSKGWWRLLSHKYARLLAPYLLVPALLCNLFLIDQRFYLVLLCVQGLCYVCAAIGLALPRLRNRVFSLPAAFTFLNAMSALALPAYLFNPYGQGWSRKGNAGGIKMWVITKRLMTHLFRGAISFGKATRALALPLLAPCLPGLRRFRNNSGIKIQAANEWLTEQGWSEKMGLVVPRAMHKWLLPYLSREEHEIPESGHILICICDHFEPLHGTDKAGALKRIATWKQKLPALSKTFMDTIGTPLKWTFFYPIEQYDEEIVEGIAEICRTGCAETEIHLHHHDDTPENLAETLETGKADLSRHGLLPVDELDQVRFGFIHGNWAIANSHAKREKCGVDHELQVLRDWGCYADFTMPAAPDPCQSRMINQIYYASSEVKRCAHDAGEPACVGEVPVTHEKLLMVQGPLGLNSLRRKFGLIPRIENADLTATNPPTLQRLRLWFNLSPRIVGRPDWVFTKLHTHGALPENTDALLGGSMEAFATDLKDFLKEHPNWKVHFVTARQLTNIVRAAENGKTGNPMEFSEDFLRLATEVE